MQQRNPANPLMRTGWVFETSERNIRLSRVNSRDEFLIRVSVFNPHMNLNDDEAVLEIIKNFLESESNDFRSPEDSDRLSQQIIDEWNKLPL